VPSSWITYSRPDCCGPIGGNGPVQMEVFLRSGASIPAYGPIFGHVLETGWDIEGGGRSLFFNPSMDRAWTIDLSLTNILNRGQHSDRTFTYNINVNTSAAGLPATIVQVPIQASVRELSRTYANAAFGREWYLLGSATDCCGKRWRFGADLGGAMGTAKGEFFQTTHTTDVIGAVLVGLHTDLECPCGCCTFLVGFRTEWRLSWMDILQTQNNSNLSDISFLANLGVRF
jgi:hypothetical protein